MEELGIVETPRVEEVVVAKPALPTTYDELDSEDLYVRYGKLLLLLLLVSLTGTRSCSSSWSSWRCRRNTSRTSSATSRRNTCTHRRRYATGGISLLPIGSLFRTRVPTAGKKHRKLVIAY